MTKKPHDTSIGRPPRGSAHKTLIKRIEILAYLKVMGSRSFGDLNNAFNHKPGCLQMYLSSLVATKNIEKVNEPGIGIVYKFVNFY
jgi:hypothetical protein